TTLSVNGGSLGSGASWHWYSGTCGGNSIGIGASITVNPLESTNYYVRAEGLCDTSECASKTILPPSNHPPNLTYTGNTGFLNHVVNPYDGTPTNIYRFEVRYTDADGNLPASTYPRIYLDFEGNGSYTNANDKLFYMLEVDPSDQNVTDGKDYYYIATSLPESSNWRTLITANDVNGCSASLGPVKEPNILNEADISIFANDISFSDANPNPGDIITVSAIIHNYSGRDADNFIVHLVNQFDPTTVFTDILVPHLGAYSSTTVSWNIQTPALPAWCPMQVFIDYTNVLIEPNELDNQAIRPFTNGNYTLPGRIVITATPSPISAPQNSTISVCGRAWYEGTAVHLLDSSCAGATVTYTVVETGQTGSTYTNSHGEYCLGIWAPYPGGTYNVNIHITDYTLYGDTTTQFIIYQTFCPDLVTSINLGPQTVNPGYCHTNDCVNILLGEFLSGTVTVSNIGNLASSPSLLQIFSPGSIQFLSIAIPVPALAPGASFITGVPAITFNSLGGTYVSATIDYNNTVAECYEGNNTSSACIMIHPTQDIVASGSLWNQYNECIFNSISFGLDNPGGVQTGPFDCRLKIYKDGVLENTLYQNVPNLPALTCTSVSFDWHSPHAIGNYSFAFEADYLNVVSELNEANNNINVSTTLIACKPDLTIYNCTNLKVDPIDPQSPGNITIYATIANNGLAASDAFDILFNVAGNNIVYAQSGLLPGQLHEISITVPTPAFGNNLLIVTADVGNVIDESNETNNTATASLCWELNLSDFGYACSGGAFWNHTQIKNQPVVFDVGLHNDGIYKASNVQIKFEVSGPGLTGWVDLGNATTYAGSTACYCAFPVYLAGNPFAFPETGVYTVRITADPNNNYIECDESNNVLIVYVTVSDRPDYRVLSQYIAPSKLNPDLDEPIGIDITYENIGMTSTDSLDFYTRVDNTHLYTVRVPGLMSGTFSTVHVTPTWSSSLRGIHVIRTIIDYNNEIIESNKLNNEATRAIIVGKAPNLVFLSHHVSDSLPAAGAQITIDAIIKNIGYDYCDATYSLYYLEGGNEVLIGQHFISLDSAESVPVSMTWTVVDPNTTLIGRISDGNPMEYDITDNEFNQGIGGALHVSFITTAASCHSASDGKAKVIIAGGHAPYTLLWSNGQTADSIITVAGVYSVTVTDVGGLSTIGSVTITEPAALLAAVTISTPAATICQGDEVIFTATPTNGGNEPEYNWYVDGSMQAEHSSSFIYNGPSANVFCMMISNAACVSVSIATSNTLHLAVNQIPGAPTGNAIQSFNAGATVADLVATGSSIKWYDAAAGGNLLMLTHVLTNGSIYYASQTVGCESQDRFAVTIIAHKTVRLHLFLEGLFDNATNTMFAAQDVDLFNGNPFAKYGDTIADQIRVDLYQESAPYSPIGVSISGINLSVHGLASFQISPVLNGNYFIKVTTRNHLTTWSAIAVPFNSANIEYFFSIDMNQAYQEVGGHDPQAMMVPGLYAFYVGDLDNSLNVDFDDFNIFEPYMTEGVYGFTIADFNGDGLTDFDDFNIFEPRLNQGVFGQYPGMTH
ncbi:MAG: CARDB domain-containing protein, partial [Bacteroidota bacterium]